MKPTPLHLAVLAALFVAACGRGDVPTMAPSAELSPTLATPTWTASIPWPAAVWLETGLTGRVYTLAASSEIGAPDRVYACTDRGFLRSADGGQQWEPVAGVVPSALAGPRCGKVQVVPDYPHIVLAQGDGLWRSDDHGATWRRVLDRVQAFAIGPGDPRVLYAFTDNPRTTGPSDRFLLLQSNDGGLTWTDVYVGCMPPEFANTANACGNHAGASALLADRDGRTLYAGTDVGVYRTVDGGRTWTRWNDGLRPGPRAYSWAPLLAMDAAGTLYAAVEGNKIVRRRGQSWQPADSGLPNVDVFGRGLNALAASHLRDGLLAAATDDGVYVTRAGGDHWLRLEDEGRLGRAWAITFGAASQGGATLYAAGEGGLWRVFVTLPPADLVASQLTPTPPSPRHVLVDRLYPIANFSVAPGNAQWSPDGNSLLLRSGSWIWTVRPDGRALRLVTEQASSPTPPVWSSDGKLIVYVKGGDGATQGIRVISPDGTGDRQVSTMDGQPGLGPGPALPPLPLLALPDNRILFWRDGRLRMLSLDTLQDGPFPLIFSAYGEATTLLPSLDGKGWAWTRGTTLLAGREGGLLTVATGVRGDRSGYAWSPEGSRLAYVVDKAGDSELWLADVDGGAQRLLNRGARLSRWMQHPSWSPDGKMIAVHRVLTGIYPAENTEIWLIDTADGYAWPLLATERWGHDPTWSPDGSGVLFFRRLPGSNDPLPAAPFSNQPWVALMRHTP